MKTTIDVPDAVMKEAMWCTGASTKRDAFVSAVKEFNRRDRLNALTERLHGPCPDFTDRNAYEPDEGWQELGERAVRLVDTSSWIEFLRGRPSGAGYRVRALLTDVDAGRFELAQAGLWNRDRDPVEKAALEMLEEGVAAFLIDAPGWRKASSLARSCRKNGLEMEHFDSHFGSLLPISKELGREPALSSDFSESFPSPKSFSE